MKMDQPSAPNAIDENRHGHIGKAMDRVDGFLKVTGRAAYGYELRMDGVAYGWIVESSIASGRIAEIDTREAEAAEGVLLVMTHRNAPPQSPFSMEISQRFERPRPYLVDDRVGGYGEPAALVVAETLEQARHGAALVRIRYEGRAGEFDLRANFHNAEKPGDSQGQPDSDVGDFEPAFAEAPVQVDVEYTTPYHIHSQIEPHAAVAWWEGDRVHIHCSTQMVEHARQRVANTLQVPPEKVHLMSPFIGGGFGGKLPVYADVILSAHASKALQRPVKIALTRQQMFHVTTHRAETLQRIRLGAKDDGTLVAIGHEAWSQCSRHDDFYEPAANQTKSLYAGANRMTRHRLIRLDLPDADSCRAPGEAVGMLALECAMDELAHRLGIDPIELRIRNEPAQDPQKQVPYSTRQLVACLREGARRFGWDRRNPVPGQVREGRWLVGMGMCAITRSNHLMKAQCKVAFDAEGVLTVRMAMTDIGTGTYTILTQIAAEMFGLEPGKVRVMLGDSDFPKTSGSGGSFGAASSGSALYVACEALRSKLAQSAGIDPAQALFGEGKVTGSGKSAHYGVLAGETGISAEGRIEPGDMDEKFSQQSYGAEFAEVAVDSESGEVRLRRMLGVFAAGRILNEKTARSQAIGGMIWGVGSALHEEAVVDPRYGYFVNHDIAEYHVPVHADIPAVVAVFLPEVDDKANPLKIKGIGELGISGAGAAVANAIFNATGVRVRDYPLRLDRILQLA
jgi:xanthine dehydrogenase YagR molybdenum-binding subunit